MKVVLEAENGPGLTLSELSVPREGWHEYLATLSTEAGAMSMIVSDRAGDPAAFFRDVGDSWRGFAEAQEYSTRELADVPRLQLSSQRCRHGDLHGDPHARMAIVLDDEC